MPDFDVFLFKKFENVNADLMVKGKKEMTNVKDMLHKNQTLPLITYHQSYGNTVDMHCFLFLVPFPSRSYAFWILRLIGFMIGITKCMRLHF